MDVSLCEMQREGEDDIGTNPYDRIVCKKQLRGIEEIFLLDIEGVAGTGYLLSTEVDKRLFGVKDVERVGHSLDEVDGPFGEVIEGVDSMIVVGVDLKVVGRVHHQRLLILQLEGHQFHALTQHLSPLLYINTSLRFAIASSMHPASSSSFFRS
jgi:hypothetical protein